jgi:DNA primase
LTLEEQIKNMKHVAATNGGEYAGPCPFCDGKDRFRVWPEQNKEKGGSYWCRQCGKKGDGIQFLRDTEGISYPEALERLGMDADRMKNKNNTSSVVQPVFGHKKYQVPDQSLAKKYHDNLWDQNDALEYLISRGFSEDTIRTFLLGYAQNKRGAWISIPHFQGKGLANVKFRILPPSEKTFYRLPGCKSILFNGDIIAQNLEEVIIAEGEFDAITLHQAGFPNVVSGTTGAESFDPEWIDQLTAVKKIYLAYDPDEAGQQGARKLAKRLGYNRVHNINLPDGHDVNEFFRKGGAEWEFMRLMDEARPFDLPGIVSIAAGFDLLESDLTKNADDNLIKTPWLNLNNLIKGFHPGDLIILSALPKIGKTTLAQNIAQHLAKNGQAALVYCLEMRPERLLRKTLQSEYRKEDINLEDVRRAKIQFSDWPLYFAHSFKKEKVEEILNLIRDAVKRYDLRFVVFDNLHFLVRSVSNVNEEIGQAVQGFKLLAEEMEIPIMAIAQPRKREAGSKEIMSAEDIKYSNSIHADCDMMIILHRKRLVSKVDDINADTFLGKSESLDPVTLVRVEAHRFGPGGETVLYMHGEQSRFDLVETRMAENTSKRKDRWSLS